MGLAHNKIRAQVDIPRWIFTKPDFMKAVLRGLWDTDGSVYKLRFGVQMSFCNRSEPLIHSVHTLLSQLGFHPSKINGDIQRIYLTRRKELYTFRDMVGFNNQKHAKRFLRFTKETARR